MNDMEPVVVRFPLAGEWCAANTPGHCIPSHGTDALGQRFAYDFLQIDWQKTSGYHWYRSPTWRSRLFGVALNDALCWAQPIYSPFTADVVEAYDGLHERNPAHFIKDMVAALYNSLRVTARANSDLLPLLGNYIILKNAQTYCLIAHAKCHSIKVKTGDRVTAGQLLAEVGHSGNSTAPHLHFQLMDSPDLLRARGIPCAFAAYQTHRNGHWVDVQQGIPGRRERIRA